MRGWTAAYNPFGDYSTEEFIKSAVKETETELRFFKKIFTKKF